MIPVILMILATAASVIFLAESGKAGNGRKTDYEGKENYCESKIIGETDLREMQNHQEKRQYQSNL